MTAEAERSRPGHEGSMTTINRILYATDLTSTSEPAWDEARRLGGLFNAEILVLHVVAPPLVFPVEGYFPSDLYQEVLRDARRDAEKGFDRLLGSVPGSGLKVRLRVEEGPVASRLLEVATQEAANLLVVGTHGRTGLQRAMLGSVADRMVRQATCPVLTVRPRLESAPRRELRRICYATDFSSTARAAWSWVVAIASAAGAEVDLVHVMFAPAADRHMPAEAIGRMAQLLQEQGQIEVERFLEGSTLPRERIHVHLPPGVAGEQIVHQAQERAADLIVMGTHGWSGVVRWMLGSVAQYVIQTAPCPVLTIAPASVSERARPDARS
jgi:nucleotide-binding universal stress UspA family protein